MKDILVDFNGDNIKYWMFTEMYTSNRMTQKFHNTLVHTNLCHIYMTKTVKIVKGTHYGR